jgi:hypothetical protein
MLCRWCEQQPAVEGSAACGSCVVLIAGQTFELLDALADLADVAIEHGQVIALERIPGRWLASLGRPAPLTGTRAEAVDLLGAVLQLRDLVRAGGLVIGGL